MRKQGWENHFSEFLKRHNGKSFKRGNNDCALFAANGIDVLTGNDYGLSFRGLYKSKSQAQNILKEQGFEDLESVADAFLGDAYHSVFYAQRGDCVLIEYESETALGLVDLTGQMAVTTGKDGLVKYKPEFWVKAWKV
ncbi:MAG: DUF6950 family protein [Alphaproteobacteria bacterium]